MEDIPLIIKVALSTAPIDRVNVFDLLIAHKGRLTTSIIEASLNMSAPTARKTMTELKAIELVDRRETGDSSHELEINLKEKFSWFLSEEFLRLRERFIPSDNRDEMPVSKAKSLKEKSPLLPPKSMGVLVAILQILIHLRLQNIENQSITIRQSNGG